MRRNREISLKKALGLALLLHVVVLAALTRVSLAAARTGNLEEMQVTQSERPAEMATVTLLEPEAPPTPKAKAAPLNFEPAPADNSEDWVKPDPPKPRTRPPAPKPANRPPARPLPGPAVVRPRPSAAGPPGGSPGIVTPGGPRNFGPPSNVTPATTSTGPGTPAGTVPGEGPGRGAGQGAGNGDNHPGGGGGNGTGAGSGNGPGRGGNGAGEGPGGGNNPGGEPKHHSTRAEQEKPVLIHKEPPVYPASAAAEGVQGTCLLRVLVGETGEVLEVEVTGSSGDRRLDAAAKECVRHWRYRPAVQNGEPRRVYSPAKVEFGSQ